MILIPRPDTSAVDEALASMNLLEGPQGEPLRRVWDEATAAVQDAVEDSLLRVGNQTRSVEQMREAPAPGSTVLLISSIEPWGFVWRS